MKQRKEASQRSSRIASVTTTENDSVPSNTESHRSSLTSVTKAITLAGSDVNETSATTDMNQTLDGTDVNENTNRRTTTTTPIPPDIS